MTCATHNPQVRRGAEEEFPKPTQPFQALHMDYIRLSKSKGKEYVLVVIDAFPKWTEMFPTKAPDAITVAKAMCKDIIPRFGIPETIYSDDGSHFVNDVIKKIGQLFHFDLKKSLRLPPSKRRTGGKEKRNHQEPPQEMHGGNEAISPMLNEY